MTIARKEIVIDGVSRVYHCISRCVRRAFLCGTDEYTGRSYEHRKDWIKNRLEHLATCFAIEVCAFNWFLVCGSWFLVLEGASLLGGPISVGRRGIIRYT